MSLTNLNAGLHRVYGGMPSGDPQVQNGFTNQNQGIGEVLPVATYRRMIPGGGRNTSLVSVHSIVDATFGATSAMTIWSSDLPNPSLASDADWVDTGTTPVDLTVSGGKMSVVGVGAFAQWVMIKVVSATSQGTLRVFAKVSGEEKQ